MSDCESDMTSQGKMRNLVLKSEYTNILDLERVRGGPRTATVKRD